MDIKNSRATSMSDEFGQILSMSFLGRLGEEIFKPRRVHSIKALRLTTFLQSLKSL